MPLVNAAHRSEEVQEAAARFEISDLTNPEARQIGMAYGRLAAEIIARIYGDAEKENLLVEALESLHEARKHAISAVLPAVRRPQFEAREAAKSTPEVHVEEDDEEAVPVVTSRPKTARTKTTAAAR
jgi:hypothetical protein